jgi:hypothetical protein
MAETSAAAEASPATRVMSAWCAGKYCLAIQWAASVARMVAAKAVRVNAVVLAVRGSLGRAPV